MNEAILHAAFIPFGDIKDVKTPLDQATQKHRSFGFVTFLEREDAIAAMDNMDGAELYGRVLTVNYALPERIKGGEQGWAAQPSMFPLKTLTLVLFTSTNARVFVNSNLVYIFRLRIVSCFVLIHGSLWC